jgi:hypothetical protein
MATGFITRAWPGLRRSCRRPLLALLLLNAAPAHAEFRLTELQPQFNAQALRLSGQFELTLSARVEEALSKGIPLEVVTEVRLYRIRAWWWNEKLGDWRLRQQIRYHALTGQYLVAHGPPENPFQENFTSLGETLRFMGSLNALALPLAQAPPTGHEYLVQLRMRLDIEALPTPLRPVAYTTPAWHLNSDWTTWKLAH